MKKMTLYAGPVALDLQITGPIAEAAQNTIDVAHDGFWDLPDINVQKRVCCHWIFEDRPRLETNLSPEQLLYGTNLGEDIYYVERALFRGFFSPSLSHARLAGASERALENLTRTAAILQIMPSLGLVFHAATLVFDEKAYLIAGHSGAGKSTISREGLADRVLTPELSILRADPNGKWTALPSPFWGHYDRSKYAKKAPLAGIMILEHGKNHNVWEPLSGIKALGGLMPHIGTMIAPQASDPRVLARITQLIQTVPVYKLAWARGTHALEGAPWIRSQ